MSYERLTVKQKKVVDLLMQGYTQKMIMKEMDISSITVKRHMGDITNIYGIPHKGKYVPHIRIMFLRAIELGIIGPLEYLDT